MPVSTAKLLDFSNEQIKDIQKLLSIDSRFSINPTSSGLCIMIDNTELFTFRSIDETWSGSRFCYKFGKTYPDQELPKEAVKDFKNYVLNPDNTDFIAKVMKNDEPLEILELQVKNSTMGDNLYSVVTFHDYPTSLDTYIDAALVCPSKRTIIFLCVYRLRYNLLKYYTLLEDNDITKLKEYTLKLFNLHRRIKNMPSCNIPAEEFEIKINTMVQLNGLNERQYDFIFKDYKQYVRCVSFSGLLYKLTRVVRFDDMLKYFDIPKPENLTLKKETEIRGDVLWELLKQF